MKLRPCQCCLMLQTEIRAWICKSEPKVSLVLAIWAALIRLTPDFGKLKSRPGQPKRAVFPLSAAPGIRAVKMSHEKDPAEGGLQNQQLLGGELKIPDLREHYRIWDAGL